MVRDEGRTIKGIAAIKTWRSETGEKYHRTVEPLSVTERGGARSKLSVCDYDRFWHIAGVPLALTSVYFEGKNGHNVDVTPFPLMTQSGQATLDGPTSVALVGQTLWAPEGQLPHLFDAAKNGPPHLPFRVVGVPANQ